MGILGFKKMREEVFAKRPMLKKVLAEHGQKSVLEYASGLKNEHSVDPQKKQELIDVVAGFSDNAAKHLEQNYYVFTADHMGPLCHPFFLNSNLAVAASKNQPIVVLATGNISLGNSSVPQGLIYHQHGNEQLCKINFFSDKHRMAPVFDMSVFTKDDLDRATKNLRPEISELILDIYASFEVLNAKNYAEQISISNVKLWQKMFAEQKLPELIYIQLEDIVCALLQKHIFAETDINKLIFDPNIRQQMIKLFNGIPAGFTRAIDQSKGTFMFWLVDEKRRRKALWPDHEKLVTEDGQYSIPLEPETISNMLQNQQLIPNTMLSLLLLSEYYGLKCVGGFSQINYLNQMSQAYHQIFVSKNAPTDHTSTFFGDMILNTIKINGQLYPATGLDLALYNRIGAWNNFINTIQTLSLYDSVNLMMPDLHKIIYGEPIRFSTNQLVKILGLENKIQAVTMYSSEL